jgi:hypothetical protein
MSLESRYVPPGTNTDPEDACRALVNAAASLVMPSPRAPKSCTLVTFVRRTGLFPADGGFKVTA